MFKDMQIDCINYVYEYGIDMLEIVNWCWFFQILIKIFDIVLVFVLIGQLGYGG